MPVKNCIFCVCRILLLVPVDTAWGQNPNRDHTVSASGAVRPVVFYDEPTGEVTIEGMGRESDGLNHPIR